MKQWGLWFSLPLCFPPLCALLSAGFSLNNALHQIIVARYSEPDLSIDFDNFVCCLVRLESQFSEFLALRTHFLPTVTQTLHRRLMFTLIHYRHLQDPGQGRLWWNRAELHGGKSLVRYHETRKNKKNKCMDASCSKLSLTFHPQWLNLAML